MTKVCSRSRAHLDCLVIQYLQLQYIPQFPITATKHLPYCSPMLSRKSLTRVLIRKPRIPRPRQLPRSSIRFFTSAPSPLLLASHPSTSTPMAARTDTAAADEANTSGITPSSLTATLKQKLDAEHVEIEDMSGGCGQAFTALIVSSQFDKKTLLARHRLVNGALKEEIAAIHAWTPRCLTPEQWQKEKEKAKIGS